MDRKRFRNFKPALPPLPSLPSVLAEAVFGVNTLAMSFVISMPRELTIKDVKCSRT